jgi:hypothetical protein
MRETENFGYYRDRPSASKKRNEKKFMKKRGQKTNFPYFCIPERGSIPP